MHTAQWLGAVWACLWLVVPSCLGDHTQYVNSGDDLVAGVVHFGTTDSDTHLILNSSVISMVNVTVPNIPLSVAGAQLTVMPSPNLEEAPVLDAAMKRGLLPSMQTCMANTVQLQGFAIINNCESELPWTQGTHLLYLTAVGMPLFNKSRNCQSQRIVNMVTYGRSADIKVYLYITVAQRTPFLQVQQLAAPMLQEIPSNHAQVGWVTTTRVFFVTYESPPSLNYNLTLISTDDVRDPVLNEWRATGKLMEPVFCDNGTAVSRERASADIDKRLGPIWVATDTSEFAAGFIKVANLSCDNTEWHPVPTLMLSGTADLSDRSLLTHPLHLCNHSQLMGPLNDDPATAEDAVLDLGVRKSLFVLGPGAQFFLIGVRVLGLVSTTLDVASPVAWGGVPPDPALADAAPPATSVLPPSFVKPPAGLDWFNNPYLWIHNSTLVLADIDFLAVTALARLSRMNRSAEVIAPRLGAVSHCLTPDVAAHASRLLAGISTLNAFGVGNPIMFSRFVGWGINATWLEFEPQDISILAYVDEMQACIWSALGDYFGHNKGPSKGKRLAIILGAVLGGTLVFMLLLLAVFHLTRSRWRRQSLLASWWPGRSSSLTLPTTSFDTSAPSQGLPHQGSTSQGVLGSQPAGSKPSSKGVIGVVADVAVYPPAGLRVSTLRQDVLQRGSAKASEGACSNAGSGASSPRHSNPCTPSVHERAVAKGRNAGAGQGEAHRSLMVPSSLALAAAGERTLQRGSSAGTEMHTAQPDLQALVTTAERLVACSRGPVLEADIADAFASHLQQQQVPEEALAARQSESGAGAGDAGGGTEEHAADSALVHMQTALKVGSSEEHAPGVLLRRDVEARAGALDVQAANRVLVSGVLGQGSWGVVFKGEWRGVPVALKTLLFEEEQPGEEEEGEAMQGSKAGDKGSNKKGMTPHNRAIMEAAIAASVGHRNVVCTYHYDIVPVSTQHGDSEGLLQIANPEVQADRAAYKMFLVQELCATTLHSALTLGALHNKDTGGTEELPLMFMLLDIAHGLEYLHQRGIIHGDLKPANVLLKADTACLPGVVAKLADFGLSSHLQPGITHISNYHSGTPFYVAPEVVRTFRTSRAADVYSFGVIMWQLYSGDAPYLALPGPHQHYVPNPLFPIFRVPRVPRPPYIDLMRRCIDRDPTARPSAYELVQQLQLLMPPLPNPSSSHNSSSSNAVPTK